MNTGRIDGKVHVERPTMVLDALGGKTERFEEVAYPWRELRFLRGRELAEARSQVGEVSCVFEIWFSPEVADMDSRWRLREDDDQNFSILNVVPVPGGRPEKLMVYCKGRDEKPLPVLDESGV